MDKFKTIILHAQEIGCECQWYLTKTGNQCLWYIIAITDPDEFVAINS